MNKFVYSLANYTAGKLNIDALTKDEKKLRRIVRHFNIDFRAAFAKANPHKITKKTKVISKSKKSRSAVEKWPIELVQAHDRFCRAFNLALTKGLDFSDDIVVGSDWYGYTRQ